MNEYEVTENADVSQSSPSDEHSDGDIDFRVAIQNQYCGRWAAEKWLVRIYLRRCRRFLRSKFRPGKPANSSPDRDLF